jgi:uncharacterized membrane protein
MVHRDRGLCSSTLCLPVTLAAVAAALPASTGHLEADMGSWLNPKSARETFTASAQRIGSAARSRSARTELVVEHQRNLVEALNSLWFKPASAVLGALLLATALVRIHVSPESRLWIVSFHASANDARQVLTVIIGALIPVTSLVFALTVVTLQIASTQFSPRLLRTFLRDGGTQLVLSGFVGTVSYCMACLFTINTDPSASPLGVPRLAITVALIFGLSCIGLLVYYIGHITNAVRIDTIMRQVEADSRMILERAHPLAEPTVDPDASIPVDVPHHAVIVRAPKDGYVQGVEGKLLHLAVRKDLTVQVVQKIGYYVVVGQPLAAVWTNGKEEMRDTTRGAVANLIEIDLERRVEHDVGLGLRQLVDIVNRAMSTGQNDPYTAAQAIHHLTTLLMDAARRSFSTREMRDGNDQIRVVLPIMDFPTHLKVVCGHVRQGGLERHPRVFSELFRLLAAVGEVAASPGRVAAVRRETELILADARRMLGSKADLEEALAAGSGVLEGLKAAKRGSTALC